MVLATHGHILLLIAASHVTHLVRVRPDQAAQPRGDCPEALRRRHVLYESPDLRAPEVEFAVSLSRALLGVGDEETEALARRALNVAQPVVRGNQAALDGLRVELRAGQRRRRVEGRVVERQLHREIDRLVVLLDGLAEVADDEVTEGAYVRPLRLRHRVPYDADVALLLHHLKELFRARLDAEAQAHAARARHRVQKLLVYEVDARRGLPPDAQVLPENEVAYLEDARALHREDVVVEHYLPNAPALAQVDHLADNVFRAPEDGLLIHALLEAEAALEGAPAARNHRGEGVGRDDGVVAVHRYGLALRPAESLKVDHRRDPAVAVARDEPLDGSMSGRRVVVENRQRRRLNVLGGLRARDSPQPVCEFDHDGRAFADAHVVDAVVDEILFGEDLGVRAADDDFRAHALRHATRFERAGEARRRGGHADEVGHEFEQSSPEPFLVE